jgi:hypothetical protein
MGSIYGQENRSGRTAGKIAERPEFAQVANNLQDYTAAQTTFCTRLMIGPEYSQFCRNNHQRKTGLQGRGAGKVCNINKKFLKTLSQVLLFEKRYFRFIQVNI